MPKNSHIYIGTSGFNYFHWSDGVFYPPKLTQRKWLEFYASKFSTVELNVTFYRLPKPAAFAGWHDRTPPDFRFIVKGSRFITHIKRLRDTEEPLERLFDLTEGLKKKLAGILWQLPPSMHLDMKRLENFLKKLKTYKTRHAFEFRHESWWAEEVFDLIKTHRATFVDADYIIKPGPSPVDYNFDFYYLRRHGMGGRYSGNYPPKALKELAVEIKALSRAGKDIFVYYNNDAEGYAVKNAAELIKLTSF